MFLYGLTNVVGTTMSQQKDCSVLKELDGGD